MFRRPSFIALIGLCGVLLSACGGTAASTQVSASIGAKSLPIIKPPAFIPGPFDGQSTRRNLALRRPLAVILENYSPDSRPQAGLAAASTVIETLAEGGVTRFMAIYLEHDATKVGPVRSTRIYFDHWAAGLHAILAHVGGNDDAQRQLWLLPKIFNVDENRWEVNLFNTGTPLFWRSQDRAAPHNLYTSTYKLRQFAAVKRENWAYNNAYLLHKQPAALKARGHSTVISIAFANPLAPTPVSDYGVKYVYNRALNTYLRNMGGTPHIDANTRQPLRPANVIVMQTRSGNRRSVRGNHPREHSDPDNRVGHRLVFSGRQAVARNLAPKEPECATQVSGSTRERSGLQSRPDLDRSRPAQLAGHVDRTVRLSFRVLLRGCRASDDFVPHQCCTDSQAASGLCTGAHLSPRKTVETVGQRHRAGPHRAAAPVRAATPLFAHCWVPRRDD